MTMERTPSVANAGKRHLLDRIHARFGSRLREMLAECLGRPENEEVLSVLSQSKPPLRLMMALGHAMLECPTMVLEVYPGGLTVHNLYTSTAGGGDAEEGALAVLFAVGFKASSFGGSVAGSTWHWSPPPGEPDLQWRPR